MGHCLADKGRLAGWLVCRQAGGRAVVRRTEGAQVEVFLLPRPRRPQTRNASRGRGEAPLPRERCVTPRALGARRTPRPAPAALCLCTAPSRCDRLEARRAARPTRVTSSALLLPRRRRPLRVPQPLPRPCPSPGPPFSLASRGHEAYVCLSVRARARRAKHSARRGPSSRATVGSTADSPLPDGPARRDACARCGRLR